VDAVSRGTSARLRRAALQVAHLLLAATLLLAEARAQSSVLPDARVGEVQIKAAFLCRFGNYVEWPARDGRQSEAFVIAALTTDAAAEELSQAAVGRTVNGRPIIVRKLAKGGAVGDASIVFVARSHASALAETLAATRGLPILTVTESDEAAGAGAMVNFVVVDERVRFDIALQQAERSSLKISGRLLTLARKVTGAPS
jgi:hypothetical protein